MQKKLIEHLSNCISDERKALFDKVLENRTRYMTVVLEDICKPFNASAVIRTADCFGVQDVHVIENKYEYVINPYVTVGATKWIDVKKYNEKENNTLDCINSLKEKGYRIVATTPHTNDTPLFDFDVDKGPFALVFGSEKPGVSDIVKENADEFLRIPMHGFTESFNISVSAALCLNHCAKLLRDSKINWELNENEKDELNIKWLEKTIKHGDRVAQDFIKKNS